MTASLSRYPLPRRETTGSARETLRRIRRTLGLALLTRGVALVAASGVAGVLFAIALDWALRLPVPLRLVLLAGVVAAAVGVAVRWLVPALRFRPSLTEIALRLERHHGVPLTGLLASGLELEEGGEGDAAIRRRVVNRAGEAFASAHSSSPAGGLMRWAPLVRSLMLLAIAAGLSSRRRQ